MRGVWFVDKKGKERRHRLPEENSVLVHVKEEVNRVQPMKQLPEGFTSNTNIWHGFAISKTKRRGYVLKFYENNTSSKRKRNNTAGETVFSSEKKQNGISNPLEYGKRLQQRRNCKTLVDNQLERALC